MFSGRQLGDLSYPGQPNPLVRSQWAFFDINRPTRAADVRDGMSNTVCMAENLTGPQPYIRGFIWSDEPNGAQVYTELAPNSPLPDRCNNAPGWCLSVPEANLPSIDVASATATCAARSRHPGGVQVLMADGAVQFISDSIDSHSDPTDPLYPGTWQKLATIDGGEVISSF